MAGATAPRGTSDSLAVVLVGGQMRASESARSPAADALRRSACSISRGRTRCAGRRPRFRRGRTRCARRRPRFPRGRTRCAGRSPLFRRGRMRYASRRPLFRRGRTRCARRRPLFPERAMRCGRRSARNRARSARTGGGESLSPERRARIAHTWKRTAATPPHHPRRPTPHTSPPRRAGQTGTLFGRTPARVPQTRSLTRRSRSLNGQPPTRTARTWGLVR